ncbi:GDNF family receptor alpha-like isoform X2 [Takifugu flavidus]|uniref:GDNF family receptor alpha-like isoform X2 n=1 Tax=Takifugu flavidus TaxID=433684 RepID=UPI002544AE95|nr:GDNF family receptor alpha-like isoform X2 [Takifugu flavidus]
MQLIRLRSAVLLGIVLLHIRSSVAPLSGCLAWVDCLSDLFKSQEAFYGDTCGDKGCQMSGFEVCNLTVQTALDRFPSLRGCVCACQEDLCASTPAVVTQCRRQAARQKRSTLPRWKSSSLIDYVYRGVGSCTDRATVCIGDAVCNRYLAPVLQACKTDQCQPDRCQQAAKRFYGSMPSNVAEMLLMCECEASDQSCTNMKTALHGSTCGGDTRMCQDMIYDCVEDDNCGDRLKTFQIKCWSSGEVECSDSELGQGECWADMDPSRILGTDSECKAAFFATVGTPLHRPCSCKGQHGEHLLKCSKIQSVFHNRSHFVEPWKSPSKLPEVDDSEADHARSNGKYADYLLLPFAAVLLVGIAILLPLTLMSKIWMLKRREEKLCQHPEKSDCVIMI